MDTNDDDDDNDEVVCIDVVLVCGWRVQRSCLHDRI